MQLVTQLVGRCQQGKKKYLGTSDVKKNFVIIIALRTLLSSNIYFYIYILVSLNFFWWSSLNLNPVIKKKKKDRIFLPENNRSAIYVHTNIHIYTHVRFQYSECVYAYLEGNHTLLRVLKKIKEKEKAHRVKTLKLTMHRKQTVITENCQDSIPSIVIVL